MKDAQQLPDWLGELLAMLGALVLLLTQAKRIVKGVAALWDWWKRRSNALPDLARNVGMLAESFKEIVRVTEARFSNVETSLRKVQIHSIIAHQQTLLMLEESDVPMFSCELPGGTCTWVNPALANLFGMETHDMLVWGWLSAIHADDIGRVQNEWLEAIRKGIPYRSRYRVTPAGEPLTVEATGRPIRCDIGTPIAVIGKILPLPIHT